MALLPAVYLLLLLLLLLFFNIIRYGLQLLCPPQKIQGQKFSCLIRFLAPY